MGSRVLEKGEWELFIHALFVVACSLQSISRLVSRTLSMAYYAGSICPGRMHTSLMQQHFLVLEIVFCQESCKMCFPCMAIGFYHWTMIATYYAP